MKISVPGFVPSTCGFKFPNYFADLPINLDIEIAGQVISLPVLNAKNGLCGGMAFTARDLFEAGYLPPDQANAPDGGPVLEYIGDRFKDSLNPARGVARFFTLMSLTYPDGETPLSAIGLAPHGRAWVMIKEELPKIKADINNGTLCPLGLIFIKSNNPADVGHNHQVTAYAYEMAASLARVYVYDPNFPCDDNVYVEVDTSNPKAPVEAHYSKPLNPGNTGLHCFFRTNYEFAFPTFVQKTGKSLHVMGTTTANRLWHALRAPRGIWMPFDDVEARAGDRGSVIDVDGASLEDVLHLVAVTSDGSAFHAQGQTLEWQALESVENQAGEIGQITSVGLAAGDSQLRLASITVDGGLWLAEKAANGPWSAFSDARAALAPGLAFIRADGAMMGSSLHLALVSADGRLLHASHSAGSWSAPEDLSGQAGAAGAVLDAALAVIGGTLHLAAATAAGKILHASQSAGGAWSAWEDVELRAGERGQMTRVSLVAIGPLLHLAAVNDQGSLWHTIRVEDGSWRTFVDVQADKNARYRGRFRSVSLAGEAG